MKRRGSGRVALACLLPCFIGFALAAAADENQSEQEAFDRYFSLKQASNESDWTGHFSVGAVVGLNISASFKENGLFAVSGNNPVNGIYDDGYVREDQPGNSGSTTYWGYNNASQYSASAQTLTFHSTSTYSTSDNGRRDEGGPFPGFDLVYGGNLYQWQSFGVGWDLGFDLMPMTISDNHPITAAVDQSTYTYSTAGIYILPNPGYRGSYNGPGAYLPTTPPPTINNNPGVYGMVTGTRSLDMMLYAIRLGPTFYWNFTKDLSASIGVGPAMGIVSAEYKYDEVITTATSSVHNSGSFSEMDVVFGGDVNATLLYHTQDQARPVDIFISAQYMPLGNANFSQGGRDGQLNLSGQVYFSAGINWPF